MTPKKSFFIIEKIKKIPKVGSPDVGGVDIVVVLPDLDPVVVVRDDVLVPVARPVLPHLGHLNVRRDDGFLTH